MRGTNLSIIVINVSFLVVNILTVLFGYFTNKLPFFISILNAIISFSLIIYWIIKMLKTKYLHIEKNEITVLIIEVLILIFAIYALLIKGEKLWVNIINYIGFGLHFIAGIGLLIFLLTFKFKRLF